MDSAGWGVKHFNELEGHGVASSESLVHVVARTTLITFTSGSTGRPKGPTGITPSSGNSTPLSAGLSTNRRADRHDLSTGVFHNLSVGNTTIMPDADIARPGNADPAKVYKQLAEHDVNSLTASPAFLSRIVDYMHEHRLNTEK